MIPLAFQIKLKGDPGISNGRQSGNVVQVRKVKLELGRAYSWSYESESRGSGEPSKELNSRTPTISYSLCRTQILTVEARGLEMNRS